MRTGRLEAFSDGVLAIIITIMVLGLRVPEGESFHELRESVGTGLLGYVLSFVYVGIYWNNHHHLFQLTERISGGVLWANLHLLFWLSLFPFTTDWMGSSGFARVPVMTYGVVLFAASIAYALLQSAVMSSQSADSPLRRAVGRDIKGRISPVLYIVGIAAAWFISTEQLAPTLLAMFCFVAVALIWLVPDRRIERVFSERSTQD